MAQWRINEEEVDNLWKELSVKMEEEFQEKYNVEEAKKKCVQRAWLAARMANHREKAEISASEMECRLLGENFPISQGIQLATEQKYAGM